MIKEDSLISYRTLGDINCNSASKTDIKEFLKQNKDYQIVHGVFDDNQVIVPTKSKELFNNRYIRPHSWEQKIENVVRNKPHISTKVIDPLNKKYWSPVGVVINDGIITDLCDCSKVKNNGERVNDKMDSNKECLESKISNYYKFFEMLVKNPNSCAMYLTENFEEFNIPRLNEKYAIEIAKSLNLPLIKIRNKPENNFIYNFPLTIQKPYLIN